MQIFCFVTALPNFPGGSAEIYLCPGKQRRVLAGRDYCRLAVWPCKVPVVVCLVCKPPFARLGGGLRQLADCGFEIEVALEMVGIYHAVEIKHDFLAIDGYCWRGRDGLLAGPACGLLVEEVFLAAAVAVQDYVAEIRKSVLPFLFDYAGVAVVKAFCERPGEHLP